MEELKILQTENYSQFKAIVANREVDDKHVVRLMQSIRRKNMLEVNPIICDKDLYVIDGQHRLEAAERLGTSIYYVISDVIVSEDISKLNSIHKAWQSRDYLNYFCLQKKENYLKLSNFLNKYDFLSITSGLILLSYNGSPNAKGFQSGQIDVDNIHEGTAIAEWIKENMLVYEFVCDSPFIHALLRALRHEGFTIEYLVEKIKLQPRKFMKCRRREDYLEMLEDVVNYYSKTKLYLTR